MPDTKPPRGIALLLAALAALGPFAIDTYLPSFPEMMEKLGATQLEMQQTLTAFLLPFAMMTLWHGAISDALGRRRVILVALAVFGLVWVGLLIGMALVVTLIATLLDNPGLAGIAMFPAAMLMVSMFFSSLYFTFRDSFVDEQHEPQTPPHTVDINA